MQEIDISKAVITCINVIILIGLPVALILHLLHARKMLHWSFEWWQQIIISIVYTAGISAEIPACWIRLKSYYQYNIVLPESFYTLSMWDRYSHMLFYVLLYLLTWVVTFRRIPESVKNTIG
jgi:hypothetical protein